MDYKRIIKSRSVRIRIMQLLSFIPDSWMLRFQYRVKTGRRLNLKNPKRFTEKLQWYKLNYRNPLMAQCVDKYEVRQHIEKLGLKNILTKCYGVFRSVEEISFDNLPTSFVLKDTLGSGGNSVIIVPDKRNVDLGEIRRQLKNWIDAPLRTKNPGREWVYDHRKHRIIAEEYLYEENGLTDYKFFCFDGKVACVYVIADRNLGGHGKLAIMNENFERIPYQSTTQDVMRNTPDRPQCYDAMKTVAEHLSKGFPHVRVDLYACGTRVVFGELTFFGASGYMGFEPDEFDYVLGNRFDIKK